MRLKASFITPIFVLVIYIFTALSRLFDFSTPAYQDNIYLLVVVFQLLIFMLPGIFFCRLKGTGYVSKMNFRLFTPGKLGFILLASIAAIGANAVVRLIQIWAFGSSGISFSLYDTFSPPGGSAFTDALYATVAFALLPAITEEFLFRGIVMTEYCESGHGAISSAIISSLMFAMLHFSFQQFPVYLIGGLVFSSVALITQSLPGAMIAHFIYNIYALFGEKYLLILIRDPESLALLIFTLFGITLLALLFALGEAERIYYGYAVNWRDLPSYMKGKTSLPPGRAKLFVEAIISPTFLLGAVFFIIVAMVA